MERVEATGLGLATLLARRLAAEPGYVVRSWGSGRYLVGGRSEAVVVIDADGLSPTELGNLTNEIAWRAGAARVRLVLCRSEIGPEAMVPLTAAAQHPSVDAVVVGARDRRIVAGDLPEDHAILRVLRAASGPPHTTPGQGAPSRRGSRPPATIALIAMNLVVFAAIILGAKWDAIPALVAFGANAPELLRSGEWWRLATAMFVHVGPVHIGFNLWALWVLGSFFERLVGWAPLVLIYLVSGLVASVASAYAHDAVSAGASGAIFGVFGLFAAVAWRPRGLVHPLVARALLRNVLMLLALNTFIGFAIPQIDMAAHMGGFVVGLVLALALPLVRADRAEPPRWLRAAGAVCMAALALTFCLSVWSGVRYLRGSDLGDPVQRTAGAITLELPSGLRQEDLDGQAEGARFARPYAGLLGVAVSAVEVEVGGEGTPPTLSETPTVEIGGRRWVRLRRIGVQGGQRVRTEAYHALMAGWVVRIEFAVLEGDEARYRHVIERALETVTPLPAAQETTPP
jgi:membrane associated rhomboid family serine protease